MNFERAARAQKRVVVTGLGIVSSVGNNLSECWNSVVNGKSGIANITKFNTENFGVKFAGEVKNFNADEFIQKKEQKKMGIFTHYAMASSQMALKQSGILDLPEDDKNKIFANTGCFIGVGMGGLPEIEEQHQKLLEKGPGRISPFFIPVVITNLASGQVSINYGLKGPNYCITSACASGAHAIGEAYNYIRSSICDVMVAGGSESTVCPLAIGGFESMRALSSRNDSPETASRPYDKDRDGFVLAEGCGILVLESLEHAVKRNANIICEVTGYGCSSDAFHMTAPSCDGSGAQRSMEMAIKDSGLHPSEINYINAHGTSTPVGDGLETLAIKNTFKDHAKKIWVSSTKSMTGHALGAAGAIESIFSIQSLVTQTAPPTINLENPSEDCDLDYVPKSAREGKINHVLNNSFGFGGTNASLIFSKLLK